MWLDVEGYEVGKVIVVCQAHNRLILSGGSECSVCREKRLEKELQKRNEYKEYVSTLILWLAGIYLVVFTVCLGLLP